MALITIQSGAHDDMHLKYIMPNTAPIFIFMILWMEFYCIITQTQTYEPEENSIVCAWRWLFGSTSAAVNRLCWLNV